MHNLLAWIAPSLIILAALMTASNLGTKVTGSGFIVFTFGALAWLAIGLTEGPPSLIWQNVVLTGLNLFGVWRWLGRQASIEEGGKAAAEASEAVEGETLFPVSLLGNASLFGTGGAELGALVDGMAGASSGRLRYVVVAEGGVAGIGETLRRVDWSNLRIEGEQPVANLDVAQFARLDALPPDQWPAR